MQKGCVHVVIKIASHSFPLPGVDWSSPVDCNSIDPGPVTVHIGGQIN